MQHYLCKTGMLNSQQSEVIPNTGLFKLYYCSGERYMKVFGAGYFTHCTIVAALTSTSHCC